VENGVPVPWMTRDEWSQLMLIYGIGFIGLYVIFAMLYLHAYRQRGVLELSETEAYDTWAEIRQNILMIGIGLVSVALALAKFPSLSGMSYMLIGPARTALGAVHGRRRRILYETKPA